MNIQVGYLINQTQSGYYDYLQNEEIEDTERKKARCKIEAMTTLIKSNREAKEVLSREFFKEREKLRNMASNSLDKAIELGDTETAEIILQFINVVYSKSIF